MTVKTVTSRRVTAGEMTKLVPPRSAVAPMSNRRPLLTVLVLIALTFGVSACSSSRTPTPAQTATPVAAEPYGQPGPHGVGVTTFEIVDTTRPTAPNGAFPGTTERRMQLEVWYPASAAVASPEARDAPIDGGPYPLIVFAHSLGFNRRQSTSYTQHLASQGYVVASPDFPSSRGDAAGGPRFGAVTEQARDVSFVIDRMLALSGQIDNRFKGAIAGSRIGVTGHSSGGLTALLTSYGPDRDPRVRAILPIAPGGCFLGADVIGDVTTPMMILRGSDDLFAAGTRIPYDLAHAPRYFVELAGADHLKFADIDVNDRDVPAAAGPSSLPRYWEDVSTLVAKYGGSAASCALPGAGAGRQPMTGARQRELLRFFGALFFDAYLRGNDGALSLLRSDTLGRIAPESTLEFK